MAYSNFIQTLRFIFSLLLPFVFASTTQAAESASFLQPIGQIAAAQREHFIVITLLTCLAIVPVFIAVPFILRRYRYGNKKSNYQPQWEYNKYLEVSMWVLPIVICIIIGVQLWRSTFHLDPYKPLAKNSLCIQAVSLDWKWLFIYPEQNIASVNKLAIPVNQPVTIQLTSDTVMQSFRISALAGQIYAMPGMQTQLNLIADKEGQARGENTQYNGDGFAQQSFMVNALSKQDWQDWITSAKSEFTSLDYEKLAQKGTAKPSVFNLKVPHLFERVLVRYKQTKNITATEQPGSEQYQTHTLPPYKGHHTSSCGKYYE